MGQKQQPLRLWNRMNDKEKRTETEDEAQPAPDVTESDQNKALETTGSTAEEVVDTATDEAQLSEVTEDKPAEEQTPPPAASTPEKKGRGAGVLAVLSLLIAVAAVAGCAYLYLELQKLDKSVAERSEQQRAQIKALDKSAEFSANISSLEDRIAQVEQNSQSGDSALTDTVGQLESAVRVLQENGARSDRDWAIAETRYLLKMAQRRLTLAGDLDTAAAATRAADEQLHALADIRLLPVREALATEIALLRSTPKPDIEGNVFALIQLARRSNSLPLKPKVNVVDLQEEDAGSVELADTGTAQPASGLRESVMSFVDRFVVVKSVGGNESDVFPLSNQGEEILGKRAGLQVALQQAQVAVLRRDQVDYRAALEEARTMLGKHFDAESDIVKRFSQDLGLLEQSPVRPELSTIGGALEMLNKVVAEWEAES